MSTAYPVADDGTRTVDTAGSCLAALCTRPAEYEVLMPGDWWWPECAEHTAKLRAGLPDYVNAVRLYERPPVALPPDNPDAVKEPKP